MFRSLFDLILFQMDEKHKSFRKSLTGVKAERRKRKKKQDENAQLTTSSSVEGAKRRNPKAFSIQNPVKAQQEFRRLVSIRIQIYFDLCLFIFE